MKLLLLHSDFIEWEPQKRAIKLAEETPMKPIKIKEVLVVFTAVEKEDEKNTDAVAANAVAEIEGVLKQVKAKNVVVYPYAHLSADLSSPSMALRTLECMEGLLKEKKIPVKRAPFGWYKSFDIKVKGHPLAELSKQVTAQGAGEVKNDISDALKAEETLKSQWYIMDTIGKLHKIEMADDKIKGYNFSKYKNLEKFAAYEMKKVRVAKQEPPHIALMKKMQLADYEPGSDPGNLRFYPKGKLIKSLIEDFVTRSTVEAGAMQVETPIMYDYEHPSLKKYMHRFPARQYRIQTPNKEVFLRFAACFGQFLMMHDASFSHKNMPLWLYELSRYSFRVEQRGELSGLKRLRAFTMPDCHSFCRDIEQAKEDLFRRLDLSIKVSQGFDLGKSDLEFALRVVNDFYEENRPYIKRIAKKWGKPILVEMWDKRFFYFILKYELNFVDALDKAAALSTDQIDVENAERYDITFTDKDNTKKYPIILHQSPSGAIERVMYAILEKAHMEKESGKNVTFPLWLSPTQVRLCPMNDSLLAYCKKIAESFKKESIRVDIDDRVESIGKKVRDAESEWIPYIIVVGDKEKKSGKLAVRERKTGKIKPLSTASLVKEIKKQTDGFPYRPLPLPMLLTKRPIFYG
ncbi:MAG: threonine--tRNA ligase [Nanoarchaeota archaeon]